MCFHQMKMWFKTKTGRSISNDNLQWTLAIDDKTLLTSATRTEFQFLHQLNKCKVINLYYHGIINQSVFLEHCTQCSLNITPRDTNLSKNLISTFKPFSDWCSKFTVLLDKGRGDFCSASPSFCHIAIWGMLSRRNFEGISF